MTDDTSSNQNPKERTDTNPPKRKSLSPGLWLLKHTQSIVTTITTLAVLKLRSSHVLYFVAGSLCTSFTAKGLKLIIKQPRPEGSSIVKTHGMPSTHSATMTFMGIYFSLSSLLLPFHPSIQPSQSYEPLLRSTLTCLGLSIPILVIWSRIKLGLHTRLQCLAGFTLGLALAFTLFLVWNGYESLNFGAGGGLESLKGTGLIESGIGIKVEEVLDPWLKSFVGQVRRKLEL